MKRSYMKNSLARVLACFYIPALSGVLLCGCATDELSPVPPSVEAVLVGIGTSCDKPELIKKGSDTDIATMDESIRYCYAGDTACPIRILQAQDATVSAVKATIASALTKDLAIIYFSCKATQVKAAPGDTTEEDGLDEALQLYDGLLLDNDIWELLKTAKNRVFLVFDTSHSGSMFRDGRAENLPTGLAKDLRPCARSNGMNMLCWSACKDEDSIDERSIGSRMTNAFYFKFFNRTDSYTRVFDRMQESIGTKQGMVKTVLGEDFSDHSVFR